MPSDEFKKGKRIPLSVKRRVLPFLRKNDFFSATIGKIIGKHYNDNMSFIFLKGRNYAKGIKSVYRT